MDILNFLKRALPKTDREKHTDMHLVEAIRKAADDETRNNAFLILVSRHIDKMYSVITSMIQHQSNFGVHTTEQDKEDIFCKLIEHLTENGYERIKGYRGESKFVSWLVPVTKNICTVHCGRAKYADIKVKLTNHNPADIMSPAVRHLKVKILTDSVNVSTPDGKLKYSPMSDYEVTGSGTNQIVRSDGGRIPDGSEVRIKYRYYIPEPVSINQDVKHHTSEEEAEQTLESTIASQDPSPEEIAEKNETAKKVRQAIDELSENCRNAVFLVDIQGLTIDESAKILKVSRERIDLWLHRGRKKIARNREVIKLIKEL